MPRYLRRVVARSRVTTSPASPDDVVPDSARALAVTPGGVWTALAAVLAVTVGGLVWLAAASAPIFVYGEGLLLPSSGLFSITSPIDGLVIGYEVKPGDQIAAGDRVAKVLSVDGEEYTIKSAFDGTLASGGTALGSPVKRGGIVGGLVPKKIDGTRQENNAKVLDSTSVFVPMASVTDLHVGMSVALAVKQFPESVYGGIRGLVTAVATSPSSSQELENFSGLNDTLVKTIDQGGEPVVQVELALQLDESTQSGYSWTIGSGPNTIVTLGSITQMSVLISEQGLVDLSEFESG
jgi:biotin carboxyl carrier protein